MKKYWHNAVLSVLHYSKTGQGLNFTGNAPCCPGRKGALMNLRNTIQIFLSGAPRLLCRKSRLRISSKANFWSVFKRFLSNANLTESKYLGLPHPSAVCEAPFLSGRWEGSTCWHWREAFLKCSSFSAMLGVPNTTFLQSQSFVAPVSDVLKQPPTVFSLFCLQQIEDLEQDMNLLAFAGLKTIQQQSSAHWPDSKLWPFLGVWKTGRTGGVWRRENPGTLQYQRCPPEWTTRNIPTVGFCLNSL